jgi:hypothetical protein
MLSSQNPKYELHDPLFSVERKGTTLLISSQREFSGINEEQFAEEVSGLLNSFEPGVKSVVFDLHKTKVRSSDRLIGPLVVLWNRVRQHHGKLAVCGLCKYGFEVLRRTRLHLLWSVCPTCDEALRAVAV